MMLSLILSVKDLTDLLFLKTISWKTMTLWLKIFRTICMKRKERKRKNPLLVLVLIYSTSLGIKISVKPNPLCSLILSKQYRVRAQIGLTDLTITLS